MSSQTKPNQIFPDNESFQEVEKLLALGCDVVIYPKSNSMMPFIVPNRDSIIIRREDEYKVGDIVVAKLGESDYVLHRLLSVSPDGTATIGPDISPTTAVTCNILDLKAKAVSISKWGKIESAIPSGKKWRQRPAIIRKIILSYNKRKEESC